MYCTLFTRQFSESTPFKWLTHQYFFTDIMISICTKLSIRLFQTITQIQTTEHTISEYLYTDITE